MTGDVTTLDELVELVAGFEPEDRSGTGTTVQQLIVAVAAINPARVPGDQIYDVVKVLDALYERVEASVRAVPQARLPAGVTAVVSPMKTRHWEA